MENNNKWMWVAIMLIIPSLALMGAWVNTPTDITITHTINIDTDNETSSYDCIKTTINREKLNLYCQNKYVNIN
jgi:hypothetical protein